MAPLPCVTQQYHLASMAAWPSSTGISHHDLPHIPSICLSAVNSSPHPGIVPQSLNSSSKPLHVPGDQRSCSGYVWLQQVGCHRSAVSLSALNVGDSGTNVWIRPLLQVPHLPRAGRVLLTLLFFSLIPSSYQVLHGSTYSFPLVRSSCLRSAGVLCALVCLKVYSSWIRGERCTVCPSPPPPSCSLPRPFS